MLRLVELIRTYALSIRFIFLALSAMYFYHYLSVSYLIASSHKPLDSSTIVNSH